jgi:apolipoprotein D and lipocalin family protein
MEQSPRGFDGGGEVTMRNLMLLATLPLALLLTACQSMPEAPMETVEQLDLERFMGDWFVIANIPTFIERDAHNAVESYELKPERQVATTFRFRDGGFDGPEKVYRPTGFVRSENNAVWGMQFLWPIKAEYLVLYIDEDYERTVIGRSKRDYIWLMARKPDLSEEEYEQMLQVATRAGYDPSKIQKVPQRWPES